MAGEEVTKVGDGAGSGPNVDPTKQLGTQGDPAGGGEPKPDDKTTERGASDASLQTDKKDDKSKPDELSPEQMRERIKAQDEEIKRLTGLQKHQQRRFQEKVKDKNTELDKALATGEKPKLATDSGALTAAGFAETLRKVRSEEREFEEEVALWDEVDEIAQKEYGRTDKEVAEAFETIQKYELGQLSNREIMEKIVKPMLRGTGKEALTAEARQKAYDEGYAKAEAKYRDHLPGGPGGGLPDPKKVESIPAGATPADVAMQQSLARLRNPQASVKT